MYIQLITIYLCYFHVKFEINSSENVYVTLKYLTWVNIFLFLVHLTSKSKVHAVIVQIYARVISILLFRCYVPSFKNYIQIKASQFPKTIANTTTVYHKNSNNTAEKKQVCLYG